MLQVGHYLFKHAESGQEVEQIHRLNYRTFVGEIPQHPDPGNGLLVDKFHAKNTYFIGLREGRLVGMISAHDQPPFSVAQRLRDPAVLQRPGARPLEVRLLAIEPEERHGTVLMGLFWSLYEYARDHGITELLISGVVERVSLYQRLGFVPLGPAVPSGGASFVPMRVTLQQLQGHLQHRLRIWQKHLQRSEIRDQRSAVRDQEFSRESQTSANTSHHSPLTTPQARRLACGLEAQHSALSTQHSALGTHLPSVSLLPGPVTVAPAVRAAFHQPPIYHRGSEFIALFQKVRRTLSELVGGRDVALFNGSGTLANEAVAAVLAANNQESGIRSQESGVRSQVALACGSRQNYSALSTQHSALSRGLILVNGEFGERLARQATRFGLRPRILTWPWGQPWDLDQVDAALAEEPAGSWVWGVHQESSTGVLNDLPGLVRRAGARGIRVCADCISSLGAVPLDLRGVYLATGASGKSLGSYAGIAIVFADTAALAPLDMSRVPSCLDIAATLASEGPRYTFPSPTLRALEAALDIYATPPVSPPSKGGDTGGDACARYEEYAALGEYVRRQLRRLGLEPLAADACACPVITTFLPPNGDTSEPFVARCRSWGFAVGGESGYLAERRMVQIATMGAVTREECASLFEHLEHWLTGTPIRG